MNAYIAPCGVTFVFLVIDGVKYLYTENIYLGPLPTLKSDYPVSIFLRFYVFWIAVMYQILGLQLVHLYLSLC